MQESETILLQRFAATGDAEAFSQIVHNHAGFVYGTCLRILANRDSAADAAQETFFQLLQNASKITGSLTGWLHRVATNKAVDMIRRDSSRRNREAKYAADKPFRTEKWEDISGHIDKALDELDEELREILTQRFFQGRSMTDVASNIGMSQPTISRRIEAGVSQLHLTLQRRGIIVAAVTLGSLLSQNAVEAAPAILMKELGKMAIVGASSSVIGAGAAASASVATAKVAGVALAGIKVKVITVAVVAAVGAGIVTYKQATKPPESSQSLSTSGRQGLDDVGRRQQPASRSRQTNTSGEQYNSEIVGDDPYQDTLTDAELDEAMAALFDEDARPETRPVASRRRRPAAGSDPNDDSQGQAAERRRASGRGMGGGMGSRETAQTDIDR
ncbi:MAG: RNA polymerase sigma factor [Planctomycetota bacterium]|jgi:RNA polymerase sigma-70 factor (ECF subfamily)